MPGSQGAPDSMALITSAEGREVPPDRLEAQQVMISAPARIASQQAL